MARSETLKATLALLALPLLTLSASTCRAQGIDLSHGGPVTVTAMGGIDWDQTAQTVTAHDDARAVRGDDTVTADVLIAHYRKKPTPPGTPATPPKPNTTQPNQAGQPADTGNNEIYRLNAEGHVHMFTPTDQAWGDHAVYDIDQAVLVLTGHNLRLTTPRDVLTARDALEYWSDKHMAVARGDATATSDDGRRITADVLVGYTVDPNAPPGKTAPKSQAKSKSTTQAADSPGKLQRVEAFGHVRLQTATDIVTGDRGVYLPDTGMARVVGHVHITRGENQLNGASAIVNMKTGLATMTQTPGILVKGLVVPNGSSNAPTSSQTASSQTASPHTAASKKPAAKRTTPPAQELK